MEIRAINYTNIDLLDLFLEKAGSSLNTFNYFKSRPFSVLNDHLLTCLMMDNNLPVGYGHLDKDGETIWLGIAIIEGYTGKGIGHEIMNYLIKFAVAKNLSEVKLSVGSDNASAISLYLNSGFKFIETKNEVSFYSWKNEYCSLHIGV